MTLTISHSSSTNLKRYVDIAMSCASTSKPPFVTLDMPRIHQTVYDLLRKYVVRELRLEGELVGWFAIGLQMPFIYTDMEALTLLTFHYAGSKRQGITAVELVHEYMEEYAEAKGHHLLMSGSMLNSRRAFERILLDNGWASHNGILWKELPHLKPAVGSGFPSIVRNPPRTLA